MSKETDIVLLGGADDVGLRLARILLERTSAVVTTVSRRAGVDSDRQVIGMVIGGVIFPSIYQGPSR